MRRFESPWAAIHLRSQDVTCSRDRAARFVHLLTLRTQNQSGNLSEVMMRMRSASRSVLDLSCSVPTKAQERPRGVGAHFAGGRLIGGI
jgi:hypothetical protein